MGLLTLGGGATVVVDVLQLRDGQVPDQFGKTIPLDAVSGQIHWSVVGSENHVLIGRLEQIDIQEGLSMTAACALCCPDSFYYSWLTPSSVSGFIRDTTQFTATRQDVDCYGQFHESNVNYGNWSTDNSGVATCDNNGFATAQGVGSTLIHNVYSATTWTPVYDDYCTSDLVDGSSSASCDVLAPSKLVRFDYTAQSPGAPNGYGPLRLTADTSNQVLNVMNQLATTDGKSENQCGVYRNLVYELQDNQGNPVTEAYTVKETFSGYSHSASCTTGCVVPSDFSKNISANGLVQDTLYFGKTLPDCPGPDANESFTQKFIVTINGQNYNLSTTNSISRGRFSGTYKVDVTITVP